MGNPKELRDARRKAEAAAKELAAIKALPRRVGSLVSWSNGVIWKRNGDDDWRVVAYRLPTGVEPSTAEDRDRRYPSSHVAQFECWEEGRGALPL